MLHPRRRTDIRRGVGEAGSGRAEEDDAEPVDGAQAAEIDAVATCPLVFKAGGQRVDANAMRPATTQAVPQTGIGIRRANRSED